MDAGTWAIAFPSAFSFGLAPVSPVVPSHPLATVALGWVLLRQAWPGWSVVPGVGATVACIGALFAAG